MKTLFIVVESLDINKSSGAKANFALIKNLVSLGYKMRVIHYSRKDIEIGGVKLVKIEEKKFSLLYFFSRFQRIVSRWLKIDFSVFLENLFGHSFTFFNDCKSIKGAITKNYNDEDLKLEIRLLYTVYIRYFIWENNWKTFFSQKHQLKDVENWTLLMNEEFLRW